MVLPGSKSPAKVHSGFPRNLGDPAVSADPHLGTGWPNPNKPWPAGRAFAKPAGAKRRERIDGTAKRRKTKRGGTGGGKSQRPDSTEGKARSLP